MTEIDWQQAFNALLSISVAGLIYWMKTEGARMHKRIDELRDRHEQSARDFRIDHNTCRAALPNEYVPRAELQAVITRIDQRMDLMTAMLTRIEERINNKCESLIKRSNPQ